MNEENQVKRTGAWMYVLAWISGFVLLIAVFDGLLDFQYNPNASPESRTVGRQIEVVLKRNKQGHYVSGGTINGVNVTFMVDTGATSVAIPAQLANDLHLTPERQGYANTANGRVAIMTTTLRELTIGNIVLNDIQAVINPGMQDDEILLGMSVLKQLEFTQRQDTLILRTL